MIAIRPALASDEDDLTRIDRETWTYLVSPSPPPGPSWTYFGNNRVQPEDVLVAVVDGEVAGTTRQLRVTLEPGRLLVRVPAGNDG